MSQVNRSSRPRAQVEVTLKCGQGIWISYPKPWVVKSPNQQVTISMTGTEPAPWLGNPFHWLTPMRR